MKGMVNWKNINANPIAASNRNQRVLDILFAKRNPVKKGQRDLFIKSDNRVDEMGLYEAPAKKARGKVTDEILDMINFKRFDGTETTTSFIFGGVEYFHKDIPAISLDKCLKPKAENNAIVFQTGNYYQFADETGKTHILTCSNGRMTQPLSDTRRGVRDDTSFEIGHFWNIMAGNGTYINLYYSEETERRLLNDAGITEGFFSVQVGERKQEYFYSNGNAGAAVPMERYNSTYYTFMERNDFVFEGYKPGDVFLVGGREYVLSEEKKLDIPYGADIFDVKWPPRRRE